MLVGGLPGTGSPVVGSSGAGLAASGLELVGLTAGADERGFLFDGIVVTERQSGWRRRVDGWGRVSRWSGTWHVSRGGLNDDETLASINIAGPKYFSPTKPRYLLRRPGQVVILFARGFWSWGRTHAVDVGTQTSH